MMSLNITLPLQVQWTADTLLFPLQYLMNISSVLLVSASILNLIFFVQAACVFYKLSVRVLGDETLAFKAAQLLCINPASIFFSAPYTESLYLLLTLLGLYQFEKKNNMGAAFFFALSGATRSNGLVNLGFLLYATLVQFLSQIKVTSNTDFVDKKTRQISVVSIISLTVLPAIAYSIICATPFLLYQYYAYLLYCDPEVSKGNLKAHIISYGTERGYKMPDIRWPSPWCDYSLPFSYSYVQNHHWGVGFLSYYEFKQIPNFMLALPMIVICSAAIVLYGKVAIPELMRDKTAEKKKNDDAQMDNAEVVKELYLKDVEVIESGNDRKSEGGIRRRDVIQEVPQEVGGASVIDSGDKEGMASDKKEELVSEKDGQKGEAESGGVKGNEGSDRQAESRGGQERTHPPYTGMTVFCQHRLLVYILHLTFLTVFAVFFMHVQVR